MSHELKRRLIGATVLISLAIIFLPMMLEHEPLMVDRGKMVPIPQAPVEKFKSSLIRDEVPEENLHDQAVDVPITDRQVVKAVDQQLTETPDKANPKVSPTTVEATPAPKPETLKSREKPEVSGQAGRQTVETSAGLSAWVIQVGSFSSRANATKLVERLRKAGLDTMEPQIAVVNGKQLYRVKVGPELNKRNAENLLPKVKKVAGLQGTVIRYP